MALNNTGFDPEKNMDSVFKQDGEAGIDFETMFDQEDDMIDTIAGLKEDGTPVTEDGLEGFDDLHNEDRDANAKDFKDTLTQPGGPNGAKNPEGTGANPDNTDSQGASKESDADKWIDNADKNYQNGEADKGTGVADDGAVVTKSINSQIKEGADPDDELDPEAECGGSCKKESCKKESSDPDDELDPSEIEDDEIDSIGEEGDLIDYNKHPNHDELEREGKEKSVIGGDSSYGEKTCNCGKDDCPICGKNNDDEIRNGKKPTDGVMEGSDPNAETDSEKECGGSCKKETVDADEDPGEDEGDTDSIEEFLNISEAGADKDVQNIEKDGAEGDLDDDLINKVEKGSSKDVSLDYSYDDEDLIDAVMNED